MAKTLSKINVQTGEVVEAHHNHNVLLAGETPLQNGPSETFLGHLDEVQALAQPSPLPAAHIDEDAEHDQGQAEGSQCGDPFYHPLV